MAFSQTAALNSGHRACQGCSEALGAGHAIDGGTTDIGFGCLSGMFERNDDVLYIRYDNGGYMNSGVQRSSATPPPCARPPPCRSAPNQATSSARENVPAIAMTHENPYVASATVTDLRDLEHKVTKAMSLRGARYIHIQVPCPLGWGAASSDTIRLACLAKETGVFPVFEAEGGEISGVLNIRRPLPVEDHLRPQKRFAHLSAKYRRSYAIETGPFLVFFGGHFTLGRLGGPLTPAFRLT